MDQIHRKHVEVNGLKLHVAEIGTGPAAVMFLHGFPEIWYSWRHQMIALADAGYRAIAPDYRGYGLSDPPPEPEKTSHFDFINDLVALLDALDIPKKSWEGTTSLATHLSVSTGAPNPLWDVLFEP